MSLPKEGDSAALIYSVDGVLIPSTHGHGNRAHAFEITDLLMTPIGATLACGAVAIGLGVKAVTSAAAKRWECWYSARRGSRQRQGRGVHAAPSGGVQVAVGVRMWLWPMLLLDEIAGSCLRRRYSPLLETSRRFFDRSLVTKPILWVNLVISDQRLCSVRPGSLA
jgi:hypothetical protein